ncbi:MAG TPA: DNA polymerase III subunit beta, partial [Labilithrix sp.]|nr:DNA polymerase III subunit beta [Labilithrix sp.]
VVTFTTKLVDSSFPPYAQVIPKSSARIFRLSRVKLADAVKAVAVSAGNNLGVRLSFNKGDLRVTSEDPTKGEGVDEVSYDLVDGKDGALVGMNSKYLGEVLTALSSDDVELGISGELDPVVARPAGAAKDIDFTGVLMPMRI